MSVPPYVPGRIWIEMEDGGPVLHMQGEIDFATVADFEEGPRDAAVIGHVVAADLAGVTFMSSVGIRLVLRMTHLTRKGSGRKPLIRRPSRPVLRILELTGSQDAFEIVEPAAD